MTYHFVCKPKKSSEYLSSASVWLRLPTAIVQTYLPSVLLVFASIASLWVPSELVPGRMTLCITTTLTLMSMMSTVLKDAPQTSYVKVCCRKSRCHYWAVI
jgi:hypothetical protein